MNILALIGFVGACVASVAIGGLFPPGNWYAGLKKPTWTPPNWVFPVVWTTLYVLMAWAAYRVVDIVGSGTALAFWALQITLNAFWSPLFFGFHRMAAAFGVMLMLWLAVAVTGVLLFQLDFLAGLMFVPYLAWLTIAAGLNWQVWRLNPEIVPIKSVD